MLGVIKSQTLGLCLFAFLFVMGCDPGGRFVLIDTGNTEKVIQFDSTLVKFALPAFWGGAGGLECNIQSNAHVTINIDAMHLSLNDWPVRHKISLNGKWREIDSIELNHSSVTIGYNVDFRGPIEKNDRIVVFANDFICKNDSCFDIDSLTFIRP